MTTSQALKIFRELGVLLSVEGTPITGPRGYLGLRTITRGSSGGVRALAPAAPSLGERHFYGSVWFWQVFAYLLAIHPCCSLKMTRKQKSFAETSDNTIEAKVEIFTVAEISTVS